MKRKFLFLTMLLTLCAVGTMKAQNSITTVTTEAELRTAVQTNGANIQFANPISTTSLLEIKDSKTITIDLKGFTLDRGCTSRGSQVIVVRTGSTLNLSNGTLTGGWGGNGGALDIETNTTVNLTDVIISGNKADDRGGGISNKGTLTMTGGSITNNTSNDGADPKGGGGLFNYNGASATLTNVTITGNEVKVTGGGGLCNYGTMTLDGCTITGNSCQMNGGGIWTAANATLNIQGAMTVTDNTTANSMTNNLFLKTNAVITVTGALTDSSIGITMEDNTGAFTSGYSTYHSGVDPATLFKADLPEVMSVSLNDNNEAQLTNALPEGSVYYIERSWDADNFKVKATVMFVNDAVVLSNSDGITLTKKLYVVKDNITINGRILIKPEDNESVGIILCDGAKLKSNYDIVFDESTTKAKLHIYGQENNSGKLDMSDNADNAYGVRIGNTYYDEHDTEGEINIHGGDLDVNGNVRCAAIGSFADIANQGYNQGSINYCSKSGVINIYSGTIRAYGGTSAAGIGGGYYCEDCGTINIYGGNITAAGRSSTNSHMSGGAGIGGGQYCYGGNINIYGGNITATGGNEAAGIGCGEGESNSFQTDVGPGNINIYGGTVVAQGGNHGAGIGKGDGTSGPCNITISGGNITARGGVDAAGIGGGEGGPGGNITISGGYVEAYGNDYGAGIGGGQDGAGGTISITGGTVIAKAGRDETGWRAFGPGSGSDDYGSLTIGDNVMVYSERMANAEERKNMCWYRTDVHVEPCTHNNATYTDNGSSIDVGCIYCLTGTMPYTFNANGNWDDQSKWLSSLMPHDGNDVSVRADATIPSGCCAHVGDITIDGGTITIADGGQLIHNNAGVIATMQKDITGHGGNNAGGWNFIASPMVTNITPSANNGFLTEDYDLYYYDEPAHYWRNFKPDGLYHGFDIESQKGYLYASQANTTLNMSGTLQSSNEPVTISGLSHEASVLNGFNLVGNPFACNATITDGNGNPMSFYVIEGRNVVPNTGSTIIPPCTGVMVQADAEHESVTFNKVTPEAQASQPNNGSLQIALAQANTRNNARIDNAIVSFKEGVQLEKFYFGNDAKVYIPQGGKDFAIAFSEGQGEMPLNFKATKNGTYTISVNPEGVEMAYLHLIDNKTGDDIDLLALRQAQGPASYTFTAKTTDYESRFRLVFVSNNEDGSSTGSEAFAFYSNGSWFIANEGRATLQVIDVTGRVLSSESINGSVSKAIDAAQGVYILKLNNKVQKIVIR